MAHSRYGPLRGGKRETGNHDFETHGGTKPHKVLLLSLLVLLLLTVLALLVIAVVTIATEIVITAGDKRSTNV